MRKSFFMLCTLLIIISFSYPAFAIEVGTEVRIENLAFKKDRSQTETTFSGNDLLYGFSIYATANITDNFGFESGFYSDDILRNISYSIFNYREKFLNIGVGPFFGFFNATSTILKSGISTAIKLELPGIAFLKFRSDSTIGGRLIEVGDYIQERNDISLGYYVHNAICSINLGSKKFTQKSNNTLETVDSLTEYSFKTEIFEKNTPYMVTLVFAYQSLMKSFIESGSTTKHTLDSILLKTNINVFATDFIQVYSNLESSIYTFGQDSLLGISNPGPGGYLFRSETGIKVNLDRFIKPGRLF